MIRRTRFRLSLLGNLWVMLASTERVPVANDNSLEVFRNSSDWFHCVRACRTKDSNGWSEPEHIEWGNDHGIMAILITMIMTVMMTMIMADSEDKIRWPCRILIFDEVDELLHYYIRLAGPIVDVEHQSVIVLFYVIEESFSNKSYFYLLQHWHHHQNWYGGTRNA